MSKNLKKIMVTGAALLMFASVGASASNVKVNARQVRSKRVVKVNHNQRNKKQIKANKQNKKNNKRKNKKNVKPAKKGQKRNNKKAPKRQNKRNNKKQHLTRINKKNKRQVKKLINRAKNKKNRNKRHAKKNVTILKSKFRRSNNVKLLRKSGFYDGVDGNIISQYAPNSPKAIIPKNVNINKISRWIKSYKFQKNPTIYNHVKNGWSLQVNK